MLDIFNKWSKIRIAGFWPPMQIWRGFWPSGVLAVYLIDIVRSEFINKDIRLSRKVSYISIIRLKLRTLSDLVFTKRSQFYRLFKSMSMSFKRFNDHDIPLVKPQVHVWAQSEYDIFHRIPLCPSRSKKWYIVHVATLKPIGSANQLMQYAWMVVEF